MKKIEHTNEDLAIDWVGTTAPGSARNRGNLDYKNWQVANFMVLAFVRGMERQRELDAAAKKKRIAREAKKGKKNGE